MPKALDLHGHTYGRLLVIGPRLVRKGHTMWLCRCSCGTEKYVASDALRQGLTTSCGCRRDEVTAARSRTHGGAARGSSRSPEYRSWSTMWSRCTNPNVPSYKYYGGRGIRVCEAWRSFETFLADMGPRPGLGHSIERTNNDGNYEPGNCHWADRLEQAANRRNNRLLIFDGRAQTVADWARELGIPAQTLYMRLHRGWPVERVLTTS